MRNYERTLILKVHIFATQEPPITWIKERSENLNKLTQITKRAYFTINMLNKSYFFSETLEWKYVKERAFLYGEVKHHMLETILKLNPSLGTVA